ncbi:MAG: hypothetical protein WCJ93_05400 [Methanomicrobiales archaeon]
MTDNAKLKAIKAVDDASVAVHNTLKDVKARNLVDDAKIAAHEAGAELKKR